MQVYFRVGSHLIVKSYLRPLYLKLFKVHFFFVGLYFLAPTSSGVPIRIVFHEIIVEVMFGPFFILFVYHV